jgi:hypothetical protein
MHHVVAENVENLDFGWRVCEVVSLAALRVRLWVRSVRLALSLCDLHGTDLGTQLGTSPGARTQLFTYESALSHPVPSIPQFHPSTYTQYLPIKLSGLVQAFI